jgi:antitoxin (DNA-binding transcriptional repressor) of toxin-antitoxin stability system
MKTVTAREFYHSSKLVDDLHAGDQLVVTANGKPKFVVSHVGSRPKMTRELAESLAIDAGTPRDFDSVAFLRSLKNDGLRRRLLVGGLQKFQ